MSSLLLSHSLIAFLARTRKPTSSSSAWAEAYRARDFTAALNEVELVLGQNPDSAEARLWWNLIQLELGDVPLGALASPVMELLPELRNQAELHELAVHICLSLAAKLAEKGQLRLGLTLAEAATELSALSSLLSEFETKELQNYTLSYYEEELQRAKQRREGKEYLTRLERRIEERKSESIAVMTEPKAPRARKNSFSSKALFEEALRDDEQSIQPSAAFGFPSAGGALANAASETETFEPFPSVSNGKTRSLRPVFAFGAATALLIALFQWSGAIRDFIFPSLFGEPGLLLAMNATGPGLSPLVLPNLELSGRDYVSRKMDTINANLAQVGERIKNIGEKNGVDNEVDHAALQASEEKLVKLSPKTEDELVPLDDPKPAKEPAADPRRTPRLDPQVVANVPVEDLGNTTSIRPSPPNLRVGPDGRLYGPPANADPAAPSGQEKALDGTPLRSYAVEDFGEPKLFRTIVATNVLSAPSLLSSAVTRLERNTSIQVVSRMGQWLELRSTQGRRGYIFAQDAVDVAQDRGNTPTH